MKMILDFFKGKKNIFDNEELENNYKLYYHSLNNHEEGVFNTIRTILFEFDSISKQIINMPNMSDFEKDEQNSKILVFNEGIKKVQGLIRDISRQNTHCIKFWNDINSYLEEAKNSPEPNLKVNFLEGALIYILKSHYKKAA